MNPTRTLISMIEFCTNNRSMEEILLTAAHYYSETYATDKFIQAVYVKSLQDFIPVLQREDDHKLIGEMAKTLLFELEELEGEK